MQYNLFSKHVLLVSVLISTPNYTPLKYECLIKKNNRVRPAYLTHKWPSLCRSLKGKLLQLPNNDKITEMQKKIAIQETSQQLQWLSSIQSYIHVLARTITPPCNTNRGSINKARKWIILQGQNPSVQQANQFLPKRLREWSSVSTTNNKVDVFWSNIEKIWTPIFEWYVVRCGF